jgi:hypothetical protein
MISVRSHHEDNLFLCDIMEVIIILRPSNNQAPLPLLAAIDITKTATTRSRLNYQE